MDGLKERLVLMLRTDREFRKDFVDFLFKYDQLDPKFPSAVINNIYDDFKGHIDPSRIEEGLKKLLDNRQIIPFLRVMKLTEYMKDSWTHRFKNVQISNESVIDLQAILEAPLTLSQLEVFDYLKDEERSVLEKLTTKEIDFLSNLTPGAINVSSTIAHLNETQKTFLLTLKKEEIRVIVDVGFERTRLISAMDGFTRNVILRQGENEPVEERFFIEFENLKTDEGRWLMSGIANLEPDERIILANLIDRTKVMEIFTPKGVGSLLEDIERLSKEDVDTIRSFGQQHFDMLKNFSVNELEILGRLDNNVLKSIGSLTKLELDELLLLPEGMFTRLSSESFRMKFASLIRVLPEGKPLSAKINRLEERDETLLGRLKQTEKVIFARIHNLPPRAVEIFFNLDLGRLNSLVSSLKSLNGPGLDLTRDERFLLEKIRNLSPEHRHDLVWMTEEELESIHEFRHFKLSGRGLEVLRAMIPLNRDQLNFIIKMSQYGLAVLTGNRRLIPSMINSIMKLDNEESQRFLINMDLMDRFSIIYTTKTIVRNHNLTPKGESLLKEMGNLSSEEIWWAQQTDYDMLEYLNKNRIMVFANLFDSTRLVEEPVFRVWKSTNELGIEHERMEPRLLANLLIAGKGKYVSYSHSTEPTFYMELLKLSIEDGYEKDLSNQIVQEIRWKGFTADELAGVYDYSTKDQIQLLKWLIKNSSDIARVIFYGYLHGRNNLILHEILNPFEGEIERGLREQLKNHGYELAQAMSLNSEDIEWVSRILNSAECLELLESDVLEEKNKIPYLLEQSRLGQDIFSIYKKNKIKLSAIMVYFDRWNFVPLFNRLTGSEIVEFLDRNTGDEFLRMSLSNGRADLLDCLRKRLSLDYLRRKLSYNIVGEMRSIEHVENMAKTLRMLYEIDPHVPKDHYVQSCIHLISSAGKFLQPDEMISIIRTLSPDESTIDRFVSRLPLTEIGGCGFKRETNRTCIDSFDRGETYTFERKNIDMTFYNDLLEYMESPVDSFREKLRKVELDTLDPKIRDTVRILKEDWEYKYLLSDPGVRKEIQAWANAAGFAFAMSIMGQGNELGFDMMNFWIVPEIGEKIPETITRFAFEELTNLYMFGTSLFVGMDVPVIAAKLKNKTGYEGEGTVIGPDRTSKPLAVFDEQEFLERMFEVGSLRNHIKRLQVFPFKDFRSTFWSDETLEPMKHLSGDEDVLKQYITRIIDVYKDDYKRIGLSLPRWIVQETITDNSTILSPARLIFDRRAVVRNPFDGVVEKSTLLSDIVEDFHLICGPCANATEVQQSPSPSRTPTLRTFTLRYRLPGTSQDQCQNMVLYEKKRSPRTNKMILYVAQDYLIWESRNDNMDLIFLGKDLTIVDSGSTVSTNNYALKDNLSNCKILKRGLNVFHTTKNQFLCDLDGWKNGQDNVVVAHHDFSDSENITSVIGTEVRNKLIISHARFVDGWSGNDNIVAGNSTIVQGYHGDTITGSATVLLPGAIERIHAIKITPSSLMISEKDGAFLEMDKNCQLITSNDYFVIPIEREDDLVRALRLHKISQIDLPLEEQLYEMRNMKNDHFKLIKHVSSVNYDIILTEMNRHVFLMMKNEHYYYWEAPGDKKNLYIFEESSGEVVISRGNGILNFEALNTSVEGLVLTTTNKGGVIIAHKDLRVTLLDNYNNIAITFNGREYYALRNNGFHLDRCSHPLKVRGKISIHTSQLIGRYNCLQFQSDKVHFVKTKNDLLLVSGKSAMLMLDYYKSDTDLSLKLNSWILSIDGFLLRARNPASVKFYRVGQDGIQIYHNLPENKYNIGMIDLTGWSVDESSVHISNDTLIISHGKDRLVTVENWITQPRAREIVFSFGRGEFLNTECVVSICSPTTVVADFQRFKHERLKRNVRSSCLADNSALLYFVFQSFLDINYPLPVERCSAPGEILAVASNVTQTFEIALRKTAREFRISLEEIDFYELYRNVTSWIREEKYAHAMKNFYSLAERICLGDERFLSTLKKHLRGVFG